MFQMPDNRVQREPTICGRKVVKEPTIYTGECAKVTDLGTLWNLSFVAFAVERLQHINSRLAQRTYGEKSKAACGVVNVRGAVLSACSNSRW